MLLGLLFHATILYFTFEKTYDAYVHMFFAEHYANHWFESWNPKWYTGFTVTSYPPLVHQIIALFSKLVGLKMGFYIWSLAAVFLLVRGVYKFSLIWVTHRAAGIAAVLAVFGSAIVEAIHIFGQLPSLTGVAFLLNACPEIYKWFRYKRWIHFFLAVGLLTVTTTAHHVSTIFGMIFFVLPVIGTVVMDLCIAKDGSADQISIKSFFIEVRKILPTAIAFGATIIILTVVVIFPYWNWTHSDPIAQVSIPHGSRENFIKEGNLGMIFFVIPWGMMLFFLPYLFRRVLVKRNIFLALSLLLAFLLGTGGTTPIPRMILGANAFDILTLDRFTFWATMMSLPFWGAFFDSLLFGKFKNYLTKRFRNTGYQLVLSFFFVGVILVNVGIVNLGNFRPFQPETIDVDPITNFLSSDQHDQWRYLTLGFGDQMAWLSANTEALTVDGNYHSARRLPELTTRAVERLENAKYQKMEGIGALKDFLSLPEKYNLKYIFSNDKFYEPVLHFNGWTKVQTLENNIVVWEYPDVPPLPKLIPSKNIPESQRLLWGTLPLSVFLITFLIYLCSRTIFHNVVDEDLIKHKSSDVKFRWIFQLLWMGLLSGIILISAILNYVKNDEHSSPDKLALAYFDALDFKEFKTAYSYLDPDTRPEFDQFMLELSVEDGILASFAKLDSLDINSQTSSDEAEVHVHANWITSMDEYLTHHQIKMINRNGNWYIKKDPFEKNIPANQFYSLPDLSFKNQGRRKALVDDTSREDILDRPEIHVIQAQLIEKEKQLYVVGSLQNIDNIPAFVSVEANIYDDKGILIGQAKASEIIVHDLLPKELTEFRIDFNCADCRPYETVLFVKTMASDKELYKYMGIQNLIKVNENLLKGAFINYGTHEINVPQLIKSQYNADKTLYWVDAQFLERGIRPQRKKPIVSQILKRRDIKILQKIETVFVNGASNKDMYVENMATDKYLYKEWKQFNGTWIHFKPNGFVYGINK